MSKRQRPRVEIARSVLRLSKDGPLIPVAELCFAASGDSLKAVSPATLVRWIIRGKGGRYLDGIHNPSQGWLSSRAALERFQGAVTEGLRTSERSSP